MVEPKLKYVSISIEDVIESDYRLEANVFSIEALRAKEVLEKCKWDVITVSGTDGLATVYHCPRFKRIYVDNSDYPIFQPSQITEIRPKARLFISEKTDTDIDNLRIKKDQILMTCSGTIGKCSIAIERLDGEIFSHDLLRITAKNPEDIGYLYAYFISKIGQTLLVTNNYGAVIQHIEPEHLYKIPIPNPSKKIKGKIHELVMESFALRESSNQLIDEAEDLLTQELKLPSIEDLEKKVNYYDKKADFRNFSVKLDLLNDRLDGSYHIPIVMAILDAIFDSGAAVKTLGDKEITDYILHPPRFKRVYVEKGEGVPFFGGKSLYELNPTTLKHISLEKHKEIVNDQLRLKKDTLLISRSGTIGKVAYVAEHWDNWVATDDLIRIAPLDTSIAGYLYIWLASDYGRILISRLVYGSVIDHIEDFHVSQIQIPILKDQNRQKEINDLAIKANQLRAKAYHKEQEALKLLEDLVFVEE